MYIRVLNKASELNDQTAKGLKCSSSITAQTAAEFQLLCSKREIVLDSFILVNKSEDFLTFHLKTMKSQPVAAALWTENIYPFSTYLQRCWSSGPLWSGAALWFKLLEGGGCGVGLAALWLSGLSKASTSAPLYGMDRQGNIFKEPTRSLKTKRHVIRLRRAGRCSRIGSCTATRPTNRGPVIRRGEQHDCSRCSNVNKVPLSAGFLPSQVWNLGSTCEMTLYLSH